MARNVAVQIMRGALANMPKLNDGEFYLATDVPQVYVGFGGSSWTIGGIMSIQIADKTNQSQLLAVESDGSILVNTGITKSLVMKTGSLVSTSVTTNQGILGYTVTAGKTFYLEYIDLQGRFTTPSGTSTVLGTVILSIGGITSYQATFVNPNTGDTGSQAVRLVFSEPLPIASATTILAAVSTLVATSTTWIANFGGYER
jgi:hypothetical protein